MINFNGRIIAEEDLVLSHTNRGYRYGDGVFETIRIIRSKIIFWEDHYFRLMASMRIARMEIPMDFTMEYLEKEILRVVLANHKQEKSVVVRLDVNRAGKGRYTPTSKEVDYMITISQMNTEFYQISTEDYVIDLFKDFFVGTDLLSTIKSSNKLINVVASIFAKENRYDNCILLNYHKMVVEATNANIFIVMGNTIKTPPLKDGCLNGIIRKQLQNIVKHLPNYVWEETSISPFELQKAEEIFITNTIVGIQPISKYKKKTFGNHTAKHLLGLLNAKARMGN